MPPRKRNPRSNQTKTIIVIDDTTSSDSDDDGTASPPSHPLPTKRQRSNSKPSPISPAPKKQQNTVATSEPIIIKKPSLTAFLTASASQQHLQHHLLPPPTSTTETNTTTTTTISTLWADKYHPVTELEIVVHPKKVSEIKAWLTSHYQPSSSSSSMTNNHTKVLLLKGPVGAGKSSTIRVLAAQYGCFISEWKAPQAATWEEARYQQSSNTFPGRGGVLEHGVLPFQNMYHSAVDSFEEFIIRCRMPALALTHSGLDTNAGGSGVGEKSSSSQSQRRLVLIEELPFTVNAQQRHRVAEALASLSRSARFPIIVCCSEATGRETQADGGGGGGGGSNSESWRSGGGGGTSVLKLVEDSLDPASYSTVTLNPLTVNMISKALHRVLTRERLDEVVSGARIKAVAEGACGDVRSALSTVQFLCTGVVGAPLSSSEQDDSNDDDGGKGKKKRKKAGMRKKKKKGKVGPPTTEEIAAAAAPFAQRDGNLTIFHALGRFLYNKRLPPPTPDAAAITTTTTTARDEGEGTQHMLTPSKQKSIHQKWLTTELSSIINPNNALISSKFQRNPTEFDPEAVLTGAGLNASSVSSFLFENYVNFVDAGAIEDAAGCCDYLSISDTLAFNLHNNSSSNSGGGGQLVQDDEVGKSNTLSDAAAALTAAMGTCFSNYHPAPRSFLPLKAPASNLVRKATSLNSEVLQSEVAVQWVLQTGCLESKMVLASEFVPSARLLLGRPGAGSGGAVPSSSTLFDLSKVLPRRWSRVWNGQLYEDKAATGNGTAKLEQGCAGVDIDILGGGGGEKHGSECETSQIEDDSESDW